MGLELGQLIMQPGKPTIVIEGPDPSTGEHVTRVNAPTMTTVSRQRADGSSELEVSGRGELGTTGEGRLAKTLWHRWREDGVNVTIRSRADGDEDRGEDRFVDLEDGRTFILQATTAIQAPQFWGDAARSSTTTTMPLEQQSAHIATALQAKNLVTPRDQRSSVVLALDARHSPDLASEAVTRNYLEAYGDPHAQYGWASVWVVGPTGQSTRRIGAGEP